MKQTARQLFMQPLRESGCRIRSNHPYGKAGTCFSIQNDAWQIDYWMYCFEDMFTISVSDMYFEQDFTQSFPLTEFASLYYYDSVEGFELPSMRPVHKGRVAGFVAQGSEYTATYRGSIPVRGVSINIMPAYYDTYLADKLPGGFVRIKEAFEALNQVEDSPDLLMVMRQLQNCRMTGSGAQLYYESKVNEALILALAHAEKKHVPLLFPSGDKRQLEKVERFLSEQYSQEISLAELARLACMSVSKLKYTFKSVYGCNTSEYIRNLRLERAKRLLQSDGISVSDAAAQVGYQTIAAFTKMFKEQTGILPKDYRKSVQGPQYID